jgi:HSP20 family protein
MRDSVLTIRGEKRNEREGRKEHSRWIERSYGSFSRSFTLPDDAISDRIKAEFREGVLTIEVPKAEEARPRVISIE